MPGDKRERQEKKREYVRVDERQRESTLRSIFGDDPRVYIKNLEGVKEVYEGLESSSTFMPDEDQTIALFAILSFNTTLFEGYQLIDKHKEVIDILDTAINSLKVLLDSYDNRGLDSGRSLRRKRITEKGDGLDTSTELSYDKKYQNIVDDVQLQFTDLLFQCLSSTTVPKTIPGTTGITGARDDGKFYISFIRMGQGDCTVFKTPEGEVGIIDCGSNGFSHIGQYRVNNKVSYTEPSDGTPMTLNDHSHFSNYAANKKKRTHTLDVTKEESSAECRKKLKEILKRPEYLGTNYVLNYLILTHKDEDHCNEFKEIINEFLLTNVFHSDDLQKYPIDKKIKNNGKNNFNVRVNKDESAVYIKTKDSKKPFTQVLDEGIGSTLVLSDYDWNKAVANPEKESSEKRRTTLPPLNEKNPIKSKIRIVASDVKKGDTNASSVVTLIELFRSEEDCQKYSPPNDPGGKTVGKEFEEDFDNCQMYKPFLKVIICGDATFETEDFMIERYERNKILSDVNIIQVPHHGSRETSSSERFIKMIHKKDEMIAVISAGKHIKAHHHPQAPIIQRYATYTRSKDYPHYSWVWSEDNVESLNLMYHDIYVLGSNGHQHFSIEKEGDPL
ncbi:hypothetical protein ACFPVX_19725 [Cohnella faecalis]|uniref:MBL fold metallo-hydrolase n=1 Tax=Cohnella faecalis TaxID=2315694 RepID=A0A398CPK2_9BACL|nr:hypothetical protein [Cohnella faecalis]RIE04322.1 hypothetical protein D3H35_06885 [Cohnella faecalis]